MGKPGIILTMEFSPPNSSKPFGDYAHYMSRSKALLQDKDSLDNRSKEAQEIIDYHRLIQGNSPDDLKDYGKYIYYMTRAYAIKEMDKTNEKGEKILPGVFSDKQEQMSKKDKLIFSKVLTDAQKKGSILWEDVVSFDNQFLEKHGLYNSKTQELDEKRLQMAARKMMTVLIKEDDLHDARWMASIHRNTDNIHIHLATVEQTPSRRIIEVIDKKTGKKTLEPRGKREQKTINKIKTTFGQELMQMDDLFIAVSRQRDSALNHLKSYLQRERENPVYHPVIEWLDQHVQPDWYKKVAFNHFSYKKVPQKGRDLIDAIPEQLAEKDPALKEELRNFDRLINHFNEEFIKMYGKKKDPSGEFKATRKKDLQERLGNAVLKELGRYKKYSLSDFSQNSDKKEQESKKVFSKEMPFFDREDRAKKIKRFRESHPKDKLWREIKSQSFNKKGQKRFHLAKNLWIAGKRSERELTRVLRKSAYEEGQRALRDYHDMMIDVERAQER